MDWWVSFESHLVSMPLFLMDFKCFEPMEMIRSCSGLSILLPLNSTPRYRMRAKTIRSCLKPGTLTVIAAAVELYHERIGKVVRWGKIEGFRHIESPCFLESGD